MKITIICKGRFHFYDLARELIQLGHDIHLITTLPKYVAKKFGVPQSSVTSLILVEIIERIWKYLPKFIKNRFNIQFFILDFFGKGASRKIKECDILIAGSATALDAIRRGREIGIKLIILERGSTHIQYQNEILKAEYKKYGIASEITHNKVIAKELIEYQEADYISVPSHFVRDTYLSYGIIKSKLLINPYGVNLQNFLKKNKLINNAISNKFTVIHCGTLSIRKGVQYLMSAFNELDLPNSELLLIGSMSEEFEAIYNKLKSKSIVHLGPFPQSSLVDYYGIGSIFCLASIEEGLAMVIPQAMACGLPVICTYNTGGSEIVRDGVDGYVVEARNISQLKTHILELYNNKNLRFNMSYSSSERVKNGFTWKDYGIRAEKIFYKIMHANS